MNLRSQMWSDFSCGICIHKCGQMFYVVYAFTNEPGFTSDMNIGHEYAFANVVAGLHFVHQT